METRITERIEAAGKLCGITAGMPQDKAAMAAMMTDAFINGMRAQERLTAGNEPRRAQA